MAFTTKLDLINAKFCQSDGGLLTLSGDTRIHDVGTLQYTSNQCATYVARSVPDVAYVTGKTACYVPLTAMNTYSGTTVPSTYAKLTSVATYTGTTAPNTYAKLTSIATYTGTTAPGTYAKLTSIATYTGTTAPNTYASKSAFTGYTASTTTLVNSKASQASVAVYTGTTAPATYAKLTSVATYTGTTAPNTYAKLTSIATYTGTTAINSFANKTDYANFSACTKTITDYAITGASNGLSKPTVHSVVWGGALTQATTLYGSQVVNINANAVNLTGATSGIRLSGTTYLAPPAGIGNLLCINTSSGQIGVTSLSSFGGVTGGTNGIIDCGNQRLGLGGALCADTTIGGGANSLTLGSTASKLDQFNVCASGSSSIRTGQLTQTASCVSLSASGMTFSDLCAVPHGILYNGDYSLSYCERSLVDKAYVDTVATGLDVHAAATVTTTGSNIALNNTTTSLDGITLVNGWRVLVRNQTADWQNGIYIVNTGGTWSRATDYNFVPPGEIGNGDLVPVITGSTFNSTIWVQIEQDPIVSGDSINFSLFSQTIDVLEGQGTCVTMAGAVHTVCVKLAGGQPTSCGLSVTNSGLCVDSGIAGNGLSYSAGVINANACAMGLGVPSLSVSYCNDVLVLATSAVTGAVGAITAANNGLTKTGSYVSLGGLLTGATTITGSDTCTLTYTDTAITNKRGILYGGDYENTFVARSLVTARYVTGKTACYVPLTAMATYTGTTAPATYAKLTSIATYTGTTAPATYAKLTSIATYTGTTAPNTYASKSAFTGYTASTSILVNSKASQASVATYTGTTAPNTYAKLTSIATYTGTTAPNSFANKTDYANFSACTKTVTDIAITGASNGLSKVGNHDVVWGGTLTQATNIYGSQIVNINASAVNLTGTSGIHLSGTTYLSSPAAGQTSDSILVWDAATSAIQKIVGSTLGDKNNIYSYTAITGTKTLSTGSSYVVLVTAPSTVTLPSPACDGQAFKIKDAAGTALTNNISIVGTIDGASGALINTNYGALEIMYTGGAWYTLSFVN
jgi:hypothetical protein